MTGELKRRLRKLEKKKKPIRKMITVQQRGNKLYTFNGKEYVRKEGDQLIIFDESVSDL